MSTQSCRTVNYWPYLTHTHTNAHNLSGMKPCSVYVFNCKITGGCQTDKQEGTSDNTMDTGSISAVIIQHLYNSAEVYDKPSWIQWQAGY